MKELERDVTVCGGYKNADFILINVNIFWTSSNMWANQSSFYSL